MFRVKRRSRWLGSLRVLLGSGCACLCACSGGRHGADASSSAAVADDTVMNPVPGSRGSEGASGSPGTSSSGAPATSPVENGEMLPSPVGLAPSSEGPPGAPPAGSGMPSGSAMSPEGGAASAGAPLTPAFGGSFALGADLSSVQEAVDGGAVYVDTDGQQKDILSLLQNHGFNFIRLRTFVNPLALYGYASGSGCQAKAQAYDDRDHTVTVAKSVKAAGMGFLLDFHYSDTWADPAKQLIPEAWRGSASIDELAQQVQAYTVDVLEALVAAGAKPDLVQVGNEITPGLLIHVPTANSDCFGNNPQINPRVNGSQANWDNLAALLRAGIAGVHQVDPALRVMLHIENTESPAGVIAWVRNAQQRGVAFDVLGLSAYEKYQGPADAWPATFTQLASTFPKLSFAIAEYNPQGRLLNDIMHELPGGRGLGTFFWEPTQSGDWGSALFTRQGNRFTANADDFAVYDQLRQDYGL